jgi:hypothetical protein
MPGKPVAPPASLLGRITNIVVVMMENRSFDHMLGYLYAGSKKRDQAAADVGGALTLSQPRTDDPLAGVKPPIAQTAPALPSGPDHMEITLAEAAMRLPVPEDGAGHQDMLPAFATGEEAVDYARRRYAAYARSLR